MELNMNEVVYDDVSWHGHGMCDKELTYFAA